MKKFTCAFLSLLLILSLALVPAYADDNTTPATVGYSAALVEEVDLSTITDLDADTVDVANVETIPGTVKISNARGLYKLADAVKIVNFINRTVYLENDIDMNDGTAPDEPWEPIGNQTGTVLANNVTVNVFMGTFDGQGHSIKNLKVSSEANTENVNVAIFGRLYGATVKNLVIDETCSFEYKGTNLSARTAALAATLFNCSSHLYSTIYNVKNEASVTASNGSVGGLIGNMGSWAGTTRVTVTNCTNTGAVTATGNAYNTGALGGTQIAASAGGFTGFLARGIVAFDGCVNTGTITAAGYAGGIVAGNDAAWGNAVAIKNSTNSGSVTGLTAGGMIGQLEKTGVTADYGVLNCTNTGNVTTSNASTGIAGQIYGALKGGVDMQYVTGNTVKADNVKVIGYQKANTATTIEGKEGTYRSVRLVGTITASEEVLMGYELVGLKITATYGDTTKNVVGTTTSVYKSLTAIDDTTSTPNPLPTLGEDEYYFAVVLENMPTTLGEVALIVIPYYVDADGVTCAGDALTGTINVGA